MGRNMYREDENLCKIANGNIKRNRPFWSNNFKHAWEVTLRWILKK
jgi:hypothetical protein